MTYACCAERYVVFEGTTQDLRHTHALPGNCRSVGATPSTGTELQNVADPSVNVEEEFATQGFEQDVVICWVILTLLRLLGCWISRQNGNWQA